MKNRGPRLTVIPILLIVVLVFPALAEPANGSGSAKRSLYAELGGNALLYSLNFEFRPMDKVAWRLGFCPSQSLVGMVSYLSGGERSSFELGAGVTLLIDREELVFLPTFTLGLRTCSASGVIFRIGLTPFLFPDVLRSGMLEDVGFILPWLGISLGFSF